eukprot:5813876-Prorocentrum_lima.AAC.1
MTSSLVGSEMCIRDSSTIPSTPAGEDEPPPIAVVLGLQLHLQGEEGEGHCLLYTSDAADDM